MLPNELDHMLVLAKKAQTTAYSPYSSFQVGVCLQSQSGQLYSGCNIENASYSLTLCAESAAIAAMITAGEMQITRLVIVSSGADFCSPCGACRQRLLEFSAPTLEIYLFNQAGELRQHTLDELLPFSFGKKDLAMGD